MSIKSITEEQILSVLSAARKHSERDYVAILVTYMHGLRATETCSLTTNNFADGFITVARLKGSLKTTHPLFSHANPLLDERTAVTDYLKTLHKGQRLCPMTRQHFHRLFKTYCAEAG